MERVHQSREGRASVCYYQEGSGEDKTMKKSELFLRMGGLSGALSVIGIAIPKSIPWFITGIAALSGIVFFFMGYYYKSRE